MQWFILKVIRKLCAYILNHINIILYQAGLTWHNKELQKRRKSSEWMGSLRRVCVLKPCKTVLLRIMDVHEHTTGSSEINIWVVHVRYMTWSSVVPNSKILYMTQCMHMNEASSTCRRTAFQAMILVRGVTSSRNVD